MTAQTLIHRIVRRPRTFQLMPNGSMAHDTANICGARLMLDANAARNHYAQAFVDSVAGSAVIVMDTCGIRLQWRKRKYHVIHNRITIRQSCQRGRPTMARYTGLIRMGQSTLRVGDITMTPYTRRNPNRGNGSR